MFILDYATVTKVSNYLGTLRTRKLTAVSIQPMGTIVISKMMFSALESCSNGHIVYIPEDWDDICGPIPDVMSRSKMTLWNYFR